MLFDVQAALAEILSSPPAHPTTHRESVAAVAGVAAPPPQKCATVHPLPVSQVPRLSQAQAGEGPEGAAPFRHGQSFTGDPLTWTGRVVSLDAWRSLTAWERHGPDGRLFCGICQAWVRECPHCAGGAA